MFGFGVGSCSVLGWSQSAPDQIWIKTATFSNESDVFQVTFFLGVFWGWFGKAHFITELFSSRAGSWCELRIQDSQSVPAWYLRVFVHEPTRKVPKIECSSGFGPAGFALKSNVLLSNSSRY